MRTAITVASSARAAPPRKEAAASWTAPTTAAAVAALAVPATLRADGHGSKDVVDTAIAAGDFKTLATALQAASLIDTLKGKGPFTVFAPTDEAFAKIPKADLDALLKDKAKLIRVLTYHVVPAG